MVAASTSASEATISAYRGHQGSRIRGGKQLGAPIAKRNAEVVRRVPDEAVRVDEHVSQWAGSRSGLDHVERVGGGGIAVDNDRGRGIERGTQAFGRCEGRLTYLERTIGLDLAP